MTSIDVVFVCLALTCIVSSSPVDITAQTSSVTDKAVRNSIVEDKTKDLKTSATLGLGLGLGLPLYHHHHYRPYSYYSYPYYRRYGYGGYGYGSRYGYGYPYSYSSYYDDSWPYYYW